MVVEAAVVAVTAAVVGIAAAISKAVAISVVAVAVAKSVVSHQRYRDCGVSEGLQGTNTVQQYSSNRSQQNQTTRFLR